MPPTPPRPRSCCCPARPITASSARRSRPPSCCRPATAEKPLHRALAFDKAWADASGGTDSPIAGTVATASVLDKPEVIAAFEREYKAAVQWMLDNPEEAGKLVETQLPQLGLKAAVMTASLKSITLEVHHCRGCPGEPGGVLSGSVGALARGHRRQAARRWFLLQLHPLDRQGRAPGAPACSTLSREWLPSSSDGSCSRCSSTRLSWPRPPTTIRALADLAWGSTLWVQLLITLKRLVIGLAVGAAVGWVLGWAPAWSRACARSSSRCAGWA